MRTWMGLIAFLAMAAGHAQVSLRPLKDSWQFRQVGTKEWHPAKVPGVVHTDLMAAGLIPDPFRNFNVDSVQWVHERTWMYRTSIQVTRADLNARQLDLIFEGLDTYADIAINGSLVLSTDNMFRRWEVPLKGLVHEGPNTVEVTFHDPVSKGAEARARYGIMLPADSDPSGAAPFVRKAAYQFGWDFAPRLLTCGIWRPVWLRVAEGVGPFSVKVQERWMEEQVELILTPHWEEAPSAERARSMAWSVRWNGQEVKRVPWSRNAEKYKPITFRVDGSDKWWPKGAGTQSVHRLEVDVVGPGGILSHWERPIGFRSIVLDRSQDSVGEAFRFLVNGRPIFMRGCNLVPPDMFLPRAGDSAWVDLVRHMNDAHMNMVRVWSGGVYPPEAFFHACDTAGILVWQDLMFGYMVPAGDSAFLRSALVEVAEQVDRMSAHPSLALFCGNNELDVAWSNWGWQDRYGLHGVDSTKVWTDHQRFFHQTLREATAPVPYTPTSPLSNWGNAAGLRSGDLHYWGVWHADSTFDSFAGNVGRFVSEYGFQSYPDSITLAHYIDPGQLHLGSSALAFRQRSYRTDRPIKERIKGELGLEPTTLGAFLNASQEVQALAFGKAIAAHAAARPRCMGTLLWQLNEPWPGPSWSVLGYGGHRKTAFEVVRKAYLGIQQTDPTR